MASPSITHANNRADVEAVKILQPSSDSFISSPSLALRAAFSSRIAVEFFSSRIRIELLRLNNCTAIQQVTTLALFSRLYLDTVCLAIKHLKLQIEINRKVRRHFHTEVK